MAVGLTNSLLSNPASSAASSITLARALARSPIAPGANVKQWAHTPSRRAAIPFKGCAHWAHSGPETDVARTRSPFSLSWRLGAAAPLRRLR